MLHHPREAAVRGTILYVHPFGEEMNKARRMAAWQARALADRGYAVLQIDLLGCGDSSGDFADASWRAWLDDVHAGAAWLRREFPGSSLCLWGLRAGCLLAAAAADELADVSPCDLLFWQPAVSGKALLQQFLRLKAAAGMADGQGKRVMQALREALAAGRTIEVAGYRLAPALAFGLEAATLQAPLRAARLCWFDLSLHAGDGAELSPASEATIAAWRAAGWSVDAQLVAGPAFWHTSEIEDAPRLIDAGLAAMAVPQPLAA